MHQATSRQLERCSSVATRVTLVAALAMLPALAARAEVRVPALIGDHMVIQQGRPLKLVGSAAPGEAVRVSFGLTHAVPTEATATADAQGSWTVTFAARPAGGPYRLVVGGSNVLTFDDIWSGEVWIASGQSNMALELAHSLGADQAMATGCAGLHLFMVPQAVSLVPRTELEGSWKACNADSAAGFSAVAFHFGRELQRSLGVPIGLIASAWAGTPAEAWTPRAALSSEPVLVPLVDALDRALRNPAERQEIARQRAAWEAKNYAQDTGNRGEALGFARSGGGGKGWSTMNVPQLWENAGLAIDGAVWFRREIVLPPEWAEKDLALSLGPVDDFDVTYWNGERVGATGSDTPSYWTAPRRYIIPGRLVRAGRNAIAVRVFDQCGNGGLVGTPAEMFVAPAFDTERGQTATSGQTATGQTPTSGQTAARISLAGPWSYRVERRLPPVVVDWGSRPRALGVDEPNSPSVLWNAMMAPLTKTPVAGFVWYQGESNVGRSTEYRTLFPTLIRSWRQAWGAATGEAALPFLFVQLPNYSDPAPAASGAPLGSSSWAELREAQAEALREPRTGMAVTLDVGDSKEIHPRNKQDVGRRLAALALRTTYRKDVIATGPTFQSVKQEGQGMRVRFSSATAGLRTSDGAPPRGFLIADATRTWHVAQARIEGDSVLVWNVNVTTPVAVRYGWADDPPNTLRSLAGLPAAPFRTDTWSEKPVPSPTLRVP